MRRALALVIAVAGCRSNGSAPGDAAGPVVGDAGSLVIGDGGLVSPDNSLMFAIVGDTRPVSVDDTANYPTAIITKIYQDLEARSPKPQLVIATGDYQYATPTGSEQQPQLDKYMSARAMYAGLVYPAMGNHECTGYTNSNCGTGNSDGITKNLTVFTSTLLAPIGQTAPYYVQNVSAADGSWTAKIVVVACNAWTTAQGTWLTQALSTATTYTFVVRHESVSDMSMTECSDSQTIVAAHPLTLLIVGHTHEYSHEAHDKEIVNGIGGAPLTSGTNYGYTIMSRNATGTLTVTTYEYSTQSTIDTFTINADGTAG